ncbi:hypothetical protein VYH28_000537 [Vibrio alginolyticus]|nr:hypothetical protein [Vibrio alginolyticus]EME3935129.1 hypothetical protein [Vibrio alginolyticus]
MSVKDIKDIKDKCELIKKNIENKDLPRMVIIDGSWGCGKTTFVKKHLMTHMEKMNPVYLSLTGVTDIAVFKDRLLSAIYFNNEKGANALENLLDASMNFFDKATRSLDNSATSSTATTLIKSLRGAAKDSIIRKIENTVIILDDLERIHCPELQRDIMGECLNLTLEDSKSIGFIFPVNMNEISIEKKQIEKYISLICVIEHDSDSYFSYAFGNYKSLANLKSMIVSCMSNNKISNIRVMKRIARKLDEIVRFLNGLESRNNNIDIDTVLSGLFKEVFIIADNHFNKGLSAHEIILNSHYSNRENESYIGNLSRTSEGIVDFICNRKLEISQDDLGYLPKKSHGFDDFLFKKPYQFHEDFEEKLKYLELFIKQEDESKPTIIWFKLLDIYMELVEEKYTKDNLGIKGDRDELIRLIERQTFNSEYLSNPNRLRIKNEFLKSSYEKEVEKINKKIAIVHLSSIFKKAESSWIDVDRYFFNNYEKKALFVDENIHNFIELVSVWNAKNTGDFIDFVKSRYSEQTRRDSRKEIDGIKLIIKRLVSLQTEETNPSLIYGTRQELISTMENTIKIIERDIMIYDS